MAHRITHVLALLALALRWNVSAGASEGRPESSPGAAHDWGPQIDAHCPHAVAEEQHLTAQWQQKVARFASTVPPDRMTRPALRRALLVRVEIDQDVRRRLVREGMEHSDPDDLLLREAAQVDGENLRWLKHVVRQDGFPSTAMVGSDGVQAAFVLTQHADSDLAFQKRMLQILAPRVPLGEIRPGQFALLTDRVLIGEGKPQRFGTQFEKAGGEFRPIEIEDAAHVDERRAALGIISLEDYACVVSAAYS